MKLAKYISKDEKILGGEPVIAGTRISVERLVQLVAKQGYTEETLLKEFPHVPRAKIRGALSELIKTGAQRI